MATPQRSGDPSSARGTRLLGRRQVTLLLALLVVAMIGFVVAAGRDRSSPESPPDEAPYRLDAAGRARASPESLPDEARYRLDAAALDARLLHLSRELEIARAAGEDTQQLLAELRRLRIRRAVWGRPTSGTETSWSAQIRIEAKTWDSWWVRVSREIARRRAAGEDLENLEAQLLHVATQREALRTEEARLLATGEAGR